VTTGWRIVPGQALKHRVWGEECVVYNNLSGSTHLIEASALQVLLALRPSMLDEAALTALLCAELELQADEAVHIPALLADLQALELIECIAC
jgi:PqqD family protein of HPr-rel-A system